jgi:hypothetical protein
MPWPSWRGGTPQKPLNAPSAATSAAVTPGVPPVLRVSEVIIVGTKGELLVYSPSAAAGNLIASIAGAAFTDSYGNHILQGVGSYAAGYANAVIGGAVIWYTGSLTGGWTYSAQILQGSGELLLDGNFQVSGALYSAANTLDDGAGNASIVGSLSVGGSTSTSTDGLPNGQISGTSGGASAGTAHTHGPGSFAVTDGQHSHTL